MLLRNGRTLVRLDHVTSIEICPYHSKWMLKLNDIFFVECQTLEEAERLQGALIDELSVGDPVDIMGYKDNIEPKLDKNPE